MFGSDISVGIVADWLVTSAGAESVIKELVALYPSSKLYSVIDFISDEERIAFLNKKSKTTFIQKLPFSKGNYQLYLPLMPLAIEQMDVSSHDIVISSCHAVSKGVLTGPDQLHISYIHSPMRYAWDLQHQYLKESGLERGVKGLLVKWLLHKMRIWDLRTVNGVDHMVANSHFIARRVKKVYGRDVDVIYPPVAIERFKLITKKDDYYITASRMVPYKRIDLIVEAFKKMPEKKLFVVGDGPEMEKIKRHKSDNIEILGYQPNDVLQDLMGRAKAFVFAAEEDFGIVVVEAQACGTPIIAYGRGGALETVRPYGSQNATGVFFHEQTPEDIMSAVEKFESIQDDLSPENCRSNALRFSAHRFREEFSAYLKDKWINFQELKKVTY
ncbi:glycosyltransferase family 4 protein [Serratia nevei]|uniref:glycosyltransferase family 4 protein n=1 Tax=Serratia nevei TaxID=2703794 RepID=UPI0027D21461|nr:glycosyltransferase family 4 protein [Serratia nevei]MDR8478329.1 glycosyltransferase family 4 protein [Serratia nevei]WMC77038.1 glycosyltransferase family 4 protein [Serratia nevei]WMC82495.1 glycosyltransferase family 4 protein [Serratia nevei]